MVAGHNIQEISPLEAGSGPDGMCPDDSVAVGESGPQRRRHLSIITRRRVAEGNEGIAPEIPRLSSRDVPATVSLDQLLIGGSQ
jgi:hypothetical protein